MLAICYIQGVQIDMMYNANKSYLFVVGKSHCETLPNLCINDVQIADF